MYIIVTLENGALVVDCRRMMMNKTMMIVQLAMMLTMTAIVCVIPVTAMSHPPFSMVVVPM